MSRRLTNRLCVVALASLSIFATGCGDDDDDDVVGPVTEEDAACKLTSVTFDDDDLVTLEYNAQGYLIKANEGDDDVTTYIYDSNNRLIKTEEREDGDLVYYTTLEYKDGLLSTVKYYEADGQLDDTETFKYDANKRLIEATEDDERTTYTYDSKGNVVKEEGFYNGELDYRIVYENYDDKQTPMSAVKGLVDPTAKASKNNPGKETYISFSGGQEVGSYIETNTYKYNSNGFPTEITATDDDSDSYTTKYSYQCK